MEQTQFDTLVGVAQSFGMWAVFAWLYIQERKAHDETRQHWLDDLRDIAGLRKSLMQDNGSRPPTESKKPTYPIET